MKVRYYIFISAAVLLSGCNDFLDKVPDNRTELDNAKTISELLVSAYPNRAYVEFCEAMSDNAEDKGVAIQSDRAVEESFKWKDVSYTLQDSPTGYWSSCYEAIAAANHALEALDKLGGMDTQAQRGEALVARAYCHFMLVNIFAQHYDPATADKDLGVPYVTEPETVVLKDYKRESVAKVYELIEQDLKEGLSLIQDHTYTVPKYHFTKAAAHAFASRFYLYKGDWDKVIEHANAVFGTGDVASQLRDWITHGQLSTSVREKEYTSAEQPSILLLASSLTKIARYQEFYRYGFNSSLESKLFRSAKVNAIGLPWAYVLEKWQADKGDPITMLKWKEYFQQIGINATTGYLYAMIPILTKDEVLLNRIEAYAMKKRYTEALADINAFYSKRTLSYDVSKNVKAEDITKFYADYASLNPFYEMDTEQAAFVQCAVELRRVEFVMEGMRWFDVKRFGIEIVHYPYGMPSQKDVLVKRDLRRAVQVPSDAIAYGLTPNPR